MTHTIRSLRVAVVVLSATMAGCGKDNSPLAFWRNKADSIAVLNTQLKARTREIQQASVEKDTLIGTLQKAMEIASDIEKLQKDVVGKPLRVNGTEAVESWDSKVRLEIADIRQRHMQMRDELTREQNRLKELSSKNKTMSNNFAHALQTIEELQTKTAQQDVTIQQLMTRVGMLETENTTLAAGNATLVADRNRVYWIAATKDSLRKIGVIKQQGGKSLLVTRVGETFTPGDALDPALFHTIDKSRDDRIALPDSADYEIVSAQNVAYATPVVPKKRRVKSVLTIKDPRFWDNSKFLILMRR